MVDLNQKAIDSQSFENLLHDGQYVCIGDHRIILSSNVVVTLIKLSIAAFGNGGLIPPVDLTDMEPLDLLDVGVVGHEASRLAAILL